MFGRRAVFFRIAGCLALLMFGCGAAGRQPATARGSADLSHLVHSPEAYYDYIAGRLEGMHGRSEASSRHLEKVLQQSGPTVELHLELARQYASAGRLTDAMAETRKALDLDPQSYEALILLGKFYSFDANHARAAELFTQAIRVRPNEDQAYTLLIGESVVVKDWHGAEAGLKKMIHNLPDQPVGYFYLASLYLVQLKNMSKAAEVYRRYLSVEPDDVRALAALGEIYIGQKKLKEALRIYQHLAEVTPEDLSVQIRVALLKYDLKDQSGALADFTRLIKDYPDSDKIVYYLGVLHENLSQYREAGERFVGIMPPSSFYADARLHLAFVKEQLGDLNAAQETLLQAIRAQPTTGPFYEYLSSIYERQGKGPEAVALMRQGLGVLPGNERLHYTMGMLLERQGRSETAIQQMRQVLRLNPDHAYALNFIGYTLTSLGRNLDEAETLLIRAMELKPGDGFITDSLGWLYFKKQDTKKAFQLLEVAHHLLPEEPVIAEHLGDVYLQMGETRKALEYYRKSLKNLTSAERPDNQEIDRIRAKIAPVGL